MQRLFHLIMKDKELLPHLFRTEYGKIIAVLCKVFGFHNMELAEDIAGDTFLLASETWGQKGLPENPTAWLYAIAKNKARNALKHHKLFIEKISAELKDFSGSYQEAGLDLSDKNIYDSQLQMMFAVCHPCINTEAQIGLALNILCGFGAGEIADAFLCNKETIYKRLARAKEKLRENKIQIAYPGPIEINDRLDAVLTIIYLLFNEGYYSTSQNLVLRKDLCVEAMRLNVMLLENPQTNTPAANALLALMCFHSSRFEARINKEGEIILYDDQDETLWNEDLIGRGHYYLKLASAGNKLTKYHFEAAIAYWHTTKTDTPEKWENILSLYNKLLQIEYSPVAALNRTYAFSKVKGRAQAISEAEKLNLNTNHFYFILLGKLYTDVDNAKAVHNFKKALLLAKTLADKKTIQNRIDTIEAA